MLNLSPLYIVNSSLYFVDSSLYSVHSSLYSVHYALYTTKCSALVSQTDRQMDRWTDGQMDWPLSDFNNSVTVQDRARKAGVYLGTDNRLT